MKEALCPWSKVFVAVCTKCHAGIDVSTLQQEGNSGENLKNFLKARMRYEGHAGACRVVNSSCLGLCPEGEQAILIQQHGENGQFLVVHPEKDREQIVAKLIEKSDC